MFALGIIAKTEQEIAFFFSYQSEKAHFYAF